MFGNNRRNFGVFEEVGIILSRQGGWRGPFWGFCCGAILISAAIGICYSYILLLSIICMGIILIGVLKPAIFLIAMVALRPIFDQFVEVSLERIVSIPLNLQSILGLTVLLVCLLYFILHGKHHSWKIPLVIPIILLLGEGIFAVVWTYDLLVGMGDWIRIASWLLLIPFTTAVISNSQRGEMLVYSCIVGGIICMVLIAIGPTEEIYGLGEKKGWFFTLHYAAIIMLAISPFVMLKILQSYGTLRIFYISVGVLLSSCILLTFVRSAWAGMLIQIGIPIVLLRRGRKIKFFSLLALIISAILVYQYLPRIETRIADLSYMDTPFYYRYMGSGRIGFWEDNLSAFWDSSFIEKIVGRGFRASTFVTEIGVGAHNDFIDLLSNNGLFGLGIIIWLIVDLFKIGRKLSMNPANRDFSFVFWGVFWTFIVVGFINGIIFYVGPMWYIAAFIGLACARIRYLYTNRTPK